MKYFILLLAMMSALAARADEPIESTTTYIGGSAENGKGALLRPQANDIARLVKVQQFDAALQAAVAVCKQYEAIFDPARRQFVFLSRGEFEEFKAGDGGNLEWIDAGYEQCLHAQAFIAAERKSFTEALAMMRRIEAVAPMSANAAIEIGYIYGQTKRPEEGLAAYRRALARAAKYKSQINYKAAALRGIGFNLIELNRLDEAEAALRESLVAEPGNHVALNEIAYIQDLRKKK